jgi:hypothetical protein
MSGVFVVMIVATPFVFAGWLIDRILRHRATMRQLAARQHYAALPAASPEMEQRLQNLEAIVTSSDYELLQRIRSGDHRAA